MGERVDCSGMRAVMDGGGISPARRLGGISFILSGTLYLIKSILDLVVGDPPSTGPEILEWQSSHELALAWTSEVLFAAAVFLVPAVIALYRSLGRARPALGGIRLRGIRGDHSNRFRRVDGARATSLSRLRHNP